MNSDIQITHEQFEQQIAAYLAEGLTADERIAFEIHAAECEVCAGRLESARGVDQGLVNLFASQAPGADFEDRMVSSLREKSRRPHMRVRLNLRPRISAHPMLIRAAGVAVAAGFLASAGYIASNRFDGRRQPEFAMKDAQSPPGAPGDFPTTQPAQQNEGYSSGKYQEIQSSDKDMPSHDFVLVKKSDVELRGDPGRSVANPDDTDPWIDGFPSLDHASDLTGRPNRSVGKNSTILATDADGDGVADTFGARISTQGQDGHKGTITGLDDLKDFGVGMLGGDSLKSDAGNTGALIFDTTVAGYTHSCAISGSGPVTQSLQSDQTYTTNTTVTPPALSPQTSDPSHSALADHAREMADMQEKLAVSSAALDIDRKELADAKDHTAELKVRILPAVADALPTTQPTTGAPASSAPAAQVIVDASRKIIRHGDMTFEVDSFDSAFLQISKIAAEEGGFITSSSSDKLDNGKMSGTIVVRLAPENLDILVLKLRGLGDLKGQSIAADDITKQYTDLQSELRAAQSMQDRMLDIIKQGKGEVKDLVAAEKELGVWREKVEVLTGEINYDNNLVALSTLTVHLTEHDIRQAGIASEHETVDMGIEAEDVEKARQNALKIIDDAQGRIIQSDLKQEAEEEYSATVVAQVPPAAAGPAIDHLRQIGRVARLEMGRDQAAPNGAELLPGAHIEHMPTQIQVSIYNLASRQPRHIVNLSVAAPDVEGSYDQIKTLVAAAGGRVVDSALTRSNAWKTIGSLSVEVPADKAESVLLQIRAQGDVMHLDRSENKDLQNTTDEKRGFVVTLASLSSIAPRETINLSLTPAPGSQVTDAYRTLLDAAVAAHATVLAAQVQQAGAALEFDISTDQQSAIESAIGKSIDAANGGRVTARDSAQSNDIDNTLATRVKYKIALATPDALGPRVVEERWLAAGDVRSAYANILAAAQTAEAHVLSAQIEQSPSSESLDGELEFVVLQRGDKAVEAAIAASTAGVVQVRQVVATDPNSATDRKIGLKLHIYDVNDLAPRQTTTMTVETSDPEQARINLQVEALNLQGRIVTQRVTKEEGYTDQITVDVPAARGQELLDWARGAGNVRSIDQRTSSVIPDAPFTHVRLDLTLTGEEALVGQDQGFWASFRTGLGTGLHGLLYSLQMIIIGLLVITPFTVLFWMGKRLVKWGRKKHSPQAKPA